MARIYQLDTISTDAIQTDHVFPAEDSAGSESVRITMAQLCEYLFNITSNMGEGSPFDSFNLIIGRESEATGSDCMAVGPLNSSIGGEGAVTRASSVGYNNEASGNWGASSMGYRNFATASRTSALGHKNTANDGGSSALGNNNTASGYGSTAAGYYNTASGTYSTAVGAQNLSSGNWGASSVGYRNHAKTSQSSAFGHKNVSNGRESSAFGSDNLTTSMESSAIGFRNIAGQVVWSDNEHNIGSLNQGSHTFTINGGDYTAQFVDFARIYGNTPDRSESQFSNDGFYTISNSTFDETNTIITVNEEILSDNTGGTIIGGTDSGTSGWGASSVGYKNQADASTSSAFGHKNVASGRQSTAFGSINTASGYGSTASGYYNTASGDYSTASGNYNTASGNYSSAFGNRCQSIGLNSTALGIAAIARIDNTVNIGGGIIVRGDFSESADPTEVFKAYSGVQNMIFSKLVDLTAIAEQTVNIPNNCRFYTDEVGIITDNNITGMTVQPTIRFGWTGTEAGLKAAAITTDLDTGDARERYTTLLTAIGQTSLTAGVTVAATADSMHGRFYWKGILVELNQSVG